MTYVALYLIRYALKLIFLWNPSQYRKRLMTIIKTCVPAEIMTAAKKRSRAEVQQGNYIHNCQTEGSSVSSGHCLLPPWQIVPISILTWSTCFTLSVDFVDWLNKLYWQICYTAMNHCIVLGLFVEICMDNTKTAVYTKDWNRGIQNWRLCTIFTFFLAFRTVKRTFLYVNHLSLNW